MTPNRNVPSAIIVSEAIISRPPARHAAAGPAAAARLQPPDILVDGMRGPSSLWYRIRINLQHVEEEVRPPQEELLADYNPWAHYTGAQQQLRR